MTLNDFAPRRAVLTGLLMLAASALPLCAAAQQFPAKPVKVVVGYAAGGAVDIVARTAGKASTSFKTFR